MGENAPSPVSGLKVTSTPSRIGFDQTVVVVSFKGARGIGNTVQANSMDEAPRIVVTTTRPVEVVYAVGNDWDGAVARTIPTVEVMIHEWVDTRIGDTFWVQTLADKVAALDDGQAQRNGSEDRPLEPCCDRNREIAPAARRASPGIPATLSTRDACERIVSADDSSLVFFVFPVACCFG